MGLGLVKELGLGFGLWVSNMDRESEKGLGANERLVEGDLGLRVSTGLAGKLGLSGWLPEEPTSEALDQLTSHLPLGPRNSLNWRSTANTPSVPSEAAKESFRPVTSFSFPRQLLRETMSRGAGLAKLMLLLFSYFHFLQIWEKRKREKKKKKMGL